MNIDKCTEGAMAILNGDITSVSSKANRLKSFRGTRRFMTVCFAAALLLTSTSLPMYANAISPANPAPITTTEVNNISRGITTFVYSRDWVNVRTAPEFGDNVVFSVEPNTKIQLNGVTGEWSEVIIRGTVYYMYSFYLSTKPVIYNGDCDVVETAVQPDDIQTSSGEPSIGTEIIERTIEEPATEDNASDTASDDTTESTTDYETAETDSTVDDIYYNTSGKFNAFSTDGYITVEEFQNLGIVNYNNECFTYYSEEVLPGEGLDIPGRYTDYDGYVCDEEGYVVLATPDEYEHPRQSTIELPTGRIGKFYDFCPEGSIDVYVNW